MSSIINGFQAILDFFSNIGNAIIDGISSLLSLLHVFSSGLYSLIKWIPQILAFDDQSMFMSYIPSMFLAPAVVIVVIYVLKIILGADTK